MSAPRAVLYEQPKLEFSFQTLLSYVDSNIRSSQSEGIRRGAAPLTTSEEADENTKDSLNTKSIHMLYQPSKSRLKLASSNTKTHQGSKHVSQAGSKVDNLLLKYAEPVNVDKEHDSVTELGEKDASIEGALSENNRISDIMNLKELVKKITGKDTAKDAELDSQELLNEAFPKQILWSEDVPWEYRVSNAEASGADRLELLARFDHLLMEKYGPVRNDRFDSRMAPLMEDLFDELVRQELLDTPARGVALANVRNSLNRMILALEALYVAGDKQFARERADLQARNEALRAQIEKVKAETLEVRRSAQNIEETNDVKRQEHLLREDILRERRQQKLEFLKTLVQRQQRVIDMNDKYEEDISQGLTPPICGSFVADMPAGDTEDVQEGGDGNKDAESTDGEIAVSAERRMSGASSAEVE